MASEIGRDEACRSAGRGDRGDRVRSAVLIAAMDEDLRPFLRESLGDCTAEARRRAGDQGLLSVESLLLR